MGPVLSRNLRAALGELGTPDRGERGDHDPDPQAQTYRPQRRFLVLLGTGDRHAIASRGAFGTSGTWVWAWKEWLDRRFLRRHARLPPAGELPRTADPGHRPADPVQPKE